MDAGCELHGYSSDVTRSWPVAGTFTPDQARVYSAVLSVWRACLALCRPGRTLHDIHATSVALLTSAMKEFGAPLSSRLPHTQPYTRFYAHSVGHWLGMDTHDCATVSLTTPLQPGVVLALEPGLYFPAHPDTPAWLWDIGIRIEDDVLITDGEPEVLSQGVPREKDDVEALLHDMAAAAGRGSP
ncbi:Putative Xaa-Pro aminopeptidase 3 [Klebsormidium nitens]|uniref:Putative Xaa-Pro aminopeptidase 3 n=1 Tax=Klebsormidium nitens TaxID=105231 RepID=A0A1Y1IMX8_KLENI|nr:Putative Xaa-Pro aminopeptidase 3 [Klebsormidium nitens]|eukprot:GAQ92240.1 Putative Xaa-Pro aminopeptidase 3 [Klebsormidium nitens]